MTWDKLLDADLLAALVGLVGLIFGSLVTYFSTRGKTTAEVALAYAQAAKLNVETQNQLQAQITALSEKLTQRDAMIDTLTTKVLELKGENSDKDRKIFELQKTVLQQEHTMVTMRRELNTLRGQA